MTRLKGSYNRPLEQRLKAEGLRRLTDGEQVVVLQVAGLTRHERDRIRHLLNRWFVNHGWVGAVRYNRDAETLTAQVLRRREVVAGEVHREGQ